MGAEIIPLIDTFVAAQKEIGGAPSWKEVGTRGEYRLIAPLLIDGSSTGMCLEVNAYPNIQQLRFRIMLRQVECFSRIDFVSDEQHVNPRGLGEEIPKNLFMAPHVHHWFDNKAYCSKFSLPKTLPVARMLPSNLRHFDATLRWFCGEYRIEQPPIGLIALPERTRLI